MGYLNDNENYRTRIHSNPLPSNDIAPSNVSRVVISIDILISVIAVFPLIDWITPQKS